MSTTTASSSSTTTAIKTASVVLVGCGCPLKSMGWYHAEQLLAGDRCPTAKLQHIVEPFYMNVENSHIPGYNEFQVWKQQRETIDKIQFFSTVVDVPPVVVNADHEELRMAIISARTCDNPQLFYDCLTIGCNTIYLEKPGAPTVSELENMKQQADNVQTQVFVGFNKNVSSYVTKTLDYVSTAASSSKNNNNNKDGVVDDITYDVTFLHNNAYENTPSVLAECFERNSEGMLKNMAIHELALLVTYYNITSMDDIESVIVDSTYSSCQTLVGPVSGISYTDFDKLKFTITTRDHQQVNIAADRSGGDDSVGIISDSKTGTEIVRYSMPDTTTISGIPALELKYPGAMPYFFTQDPDYAELKERVAQACVQRVKPIGVATIETAIQALKLAEYLTPILQEQLLVKK